MIKYSSTEPLLGFKTIKMKSPMADVTSKVVIVFEHPESTSENPSIVAVTVPWLILNGSPKTRQGKPWVFKSTEILQ